MHKFIIKAFIFLGMLLCYFGINAAVNLIIISNLKPDVKRSEILIIGDSHPQRALNPQLFDNTQNISQIAEPYIITYWKLKSLLDIVDPDTVIVGFAPHNISAFNDLKFSERGTASEMFKRSYLIENFKLVKSIEINYSEYYRVLWKQLCFFPKTDHFNYIGSYTNRNLSKITDTEYVINQHYYAKNQFLGISETAIAYLDSMVNLCKSKNITPIFVSSPVHNSYYTLIPKPIKERFEIEKRRLESQGILVIDKTADFYPDSYYLNTDHLNEKGANRFSKEIRKIISTNAHPRKSPNVH